MKKFIQLSRKYKPAKMSASEREALLERLYAIHCQLFDGVDKAAFCKYVVEPQTKRSGIYLIQNREGEDVGYLTCQLFQVQVGPKRKPLVFRTELGILPAYRGSNKPFRKLFWDIASYLIPRGLPEAYFLATPINPLAYKVAEGLIGEFYPRPDEALPASMALTMETLSESLQLRDASGGTFSKYVGWRTRFSPSELQRLHACKHPAIQYYIQQNPDFESGNGLLFVAPANFKNAFSTLKRFVLRYWRRQRPRVLSLISFSLKAKPRPQTAC